MSTESPYHLSHLLQVYKNKSDFMHIFNDFIYVYSPGEMSTRSPYHFAHLLQFKTKLL